MISGASGLNFNIKSDLVANNTATVAEALNCVKEDPESDATLACLRTAPFDDLINVSVSLSRHKDLPLASFFSIQALTRITFWIDPRCYFDRVVS